MMRLKRLWFILVIHLAESDVTFQQVANRLEVTFDQVGEGGACEMGSIRRVLEGGLDATCQPFTRLHSAIMDANGDVLVASKNIMLDMVKIDEQYFELKSIKHEMIDETHAKYMFINSDNHDGIWCIQQEIRLRKEIVGTRSEPSCVEERVVSVLETVEKFKSTIEKDKGLTWNGNGLTDVVVVMATSPPSPSHSRTSDKSTLNTLIVAACCLILSVAIPALVFYRRHAKRSEYAVSPPTFLSEWLGSSPNDDYTDIVIADKSENLELM